MTNEAEERFDMTISMTMSSQVAQPTGMRTPMEMLGSYWDCLLFHVPVAVCMYLSSYEFIGFV